MDDDEEEFLKLAAIILADSPQGIDLENEDVMELAVLWRVDLKESIPDLRERVKHINPKPSETKIQSAYKYLKRNL